MYLVREHPGPDRGQQLAFGMTAAVIALSLVLLTGYAGEINLAVLSFGAIGAIVVHHFGVSGGGVAPARRCSATCWPPRCALVGALVALPSLRPARAVPGAVDHGVRRVRVQHDPARDHRAEAAAAAHPVQHLPERQPGRAAPKFGPVDLAAMPTFLMFVTVLFAVLGVGLVVLRTAATGAAHRHEGQPAASATLGQSMV